MERGTCKQSAFFQAHADHLQKSEYLNDIGIMKLLKFTKNNLSFSPAITNIRPTSFSRRMVRSMSLRLGGERAVASKALGSPMSSNFTFNIVLPNGQR